MPVSRTVVIVREATPGDIPNLIQLIHEHTAFERAAPPSDDLAVRLAGLLFAPAPRLHAIVAEIEDVIVGYSTASLETSTWRGREFLHMDCLYLREDARGSGVGGMLLDAVRRLAIELGVDQVEWQTPQWNEGAVRFYDRTGAERNPKHRYTLTVGDAQKEQPITDSRY
jgi:GNAT superfamily N-acetyltransferase